MTLLIVSFIAGILTVLAPCVLPLLPVILAGSLSETSNKRRPLIIISSLSISVFIFTLILKGSTALIGASPTFWNYISATILMCFGLTLIFPITWAKIVLKIPGHNTPDRWITKGFNTNKDKSATNSSLVWTDIIVGAALGPVFTTCSPTFFVILATVLPQSLAMGLIDLATYIIGLALVLLLIAIIGQRLIDKLGWAIDPNGWFRKTLGILFIILALGIAFGYDKKIETAILKSGFFDVTTLEQSIHQKLENNTSNQTSDLPTPSIQLHTSDYVEIQNPAGFVNSQPFKLADFIGKKVILVDFIDYSCINCERTFPYLENWWNTYKDQGLEVVAIHTPEFSFEKDIHNVQMAAKRFGLTFPIVLDNDYKTWNAYRNEYWPHKYLIDIHGNMVYDKIGEGDDNLVEAQIVKALNERSTYLGQHNTISTGTSTLSDYTVQTESPETYFGAIRNEYFGNGIPFITNSHTFTIPDTLSTNQFYLGGTWNIEKEYAENISTSSQLSYRFTSSKVYVIAESIDGSTVDAHVLIDGKPISPEFFGADVTTDGILKINQSRLYNVYSSSKLEQHRVDIIFSKPKVRVYTFTFG